MIEILRKEDCAGCAACANICSADCIRMIADEEGFLYPDVTKEKCVGCEKCKKACPIMNPVAETPFEQTAYLVQHLDERVRSESTSGGAFTAIAQYVLKNGGVVYGAAFDDNLKVRHVYVEHEEELAVFRGSKYVQSEIGFSYREARKFLEQGRMVCFSGTPCQIEGLTRFLQEEYPGLLFTVDVVCRAVPSPAFFEKYLAYQAEKTKGIVTSVSFRDKTFYGYQHSQMSVKIADGAIYHKGVESDPFLRAFFSDLCDRPSCYACKFKKRWRISDFTVWDCFEPERYAAQLNDKKGTTKLLIHTENGKKMFEAIKKSVRFVAIAPDDAVNGVREMFHSVKQNPRRKDFFADLTRMNDTEFFEKYFPTTLRVQLESIVRRVSARLGLYRLIRRIYKRISSMK